MTTPSATAPAGRELLSRLSLAIMQKASGRTERVPAELLPDRITVEMPDLDAAIELAIGEHCNTHSHLLAQNAAMLKQCEWLTQEWRDLASTSNDRYHNCGDYERGYGGGIGFAKAYARRVLRNIDDADIAKVSP